MNSQAMRERILVIDVLRGLVMLLMLVDHVREYFFLHRQVSDPMDLASTATGLFFTRLTSHFCAPTFIFLTGLGAYLYQQRYETSKLQTSRYLLTRGVLFVLLEISVVNFAWSFDLRPTILYLQVIWAIGLCMIALAALCWLPRLLQIGFALFIICGHNLFDSVHYSPHEFGYWIWHILHDRAVLPLSETLAVRTSYPVLPWIGVILLGYTFGALYRADISSQLRQKYLCIWGIATLCMFALVRFLNGYGDLPRIIDASILVQLMSWVNLTKYPPSFLYLTFTLGLLFLLLSYFESRQGPKFLSVYGRVPLFFYISHLYVLHLMYVVCVSVYGLNQGSRYGFDHIYQIWLFAILLAIFFYPVCHWFARFKKQSQSKWAPYL